MPVVMALLELVEAYPRYGFPKYFAVLRRKGHNWNHKRAHRIYRELNLHLRRKGKRRLPARKQYALRRKLPQTCVGQLILLATA